MDIVAEADPSEPSSDLLYRHTKRENWGVAVFMWERDEKRAFHFADGEIRVFKKGFYQLMVETIPPGDGSADRLRAQVRASISGKKIEILPTVGDQLVLLLRDYPKGFIGGPWHKMHRGEGRRLKRHRDPAIAEAKKLLDPVALEKAHAAGTYNEALIRFTEVLKNTDLVPSAHVKKLQATQPTKDLSLALLETAKDPAKASLRRLQAALVGAKGPATSWQVLTAPLTLLSPRNHICVRPSVFAIQGKVVLPRFNPPKRPSQAGYQRYVDVARAVEEELQALGHAPVDMLDIHDFVWTTLRPAAQEELARINHANETTKAPEGIAETTTKAPGSPGA